MCHFLCDCKFFQVAAHLVPGDLNVLLARNLVTIKDAEGYVAGTAKFPDFPIDEVLYDFFHQMANTLSPPPESLYHYQAFRSEEHENRLRTLLRERKLYFSTPHVFNDPWDCRPYYDPGAFHELARTPDGIRLIKSIIGDTPETALMLNNPIFRDRLVNGVTENTRINMQRWRIYCVSPDPDINLMWSHYAESHSGICLQFSSQNWLISQARKVSYSKVYPRLRLDQEDAAEEMLLTKSCDWHYEKEWRILVRSKGAVPAKHSGRILEADKDGCVPLPEGALEAVIVGARGDGSRVAQILNECAPDIPLKIARLQSDAYALRIESS